MPAISVIVPTRLRNHLLPRAVRSLLAQTLTDFEIVVVDDNPPESRVSTDANLAALLQHPNVRVLTHSQPRNAACARNIGLQAARGDWITYLDDDDAYRPSKLQKQWQYAMKSGLPMGICGVNFQLARRERRWQISSNEISRKELLLTPFALPTLFHQNARTIFFEESLSAGEDAYYFYKLIAHFNTDRIFNVTEALVDVYPQPGPRVNINAEGAWEAAQAIYRDFAPTYGTIAANTFLARSYLGYLKLRKGGAAQMLRPAMALLRLGGWREVRPIANAFLFKVPWARRFLVS